MVFRAIEDAKVHAKEPDRNFGSSNLQVRNDDRQSYVRFDLTGTRGRPIVRALLRLYLTHASPSSGFAYQTDADWSEATLTWNTRPTPVEPPLESGGVAEAGGYVTYDVTAAAFTDGPISFVLRAGLNKSVMFASIETDAARRPELEITFGP